MSTISEVATGPWLEYSMYTLENRAIPSMIDGLKPVQRFIMYSALMNAKKSTIKVAALAGPVATYGYNHGEQNAQGAAMLMAAEWCNNQPLLEGDGNFGNRMITDGAAARYVYAKVHPKFFDLYSDFNLCPVHPDIEHLPPRYYLPKIPMVLINGVKGIATGFATDILPYSIKDVTKLCKKIVQGKDTSSDKLIPTFPGFRGQVVPNSRGGFDVIGTFERQGATGLTITEVPFEFDRESYIKILDDLEDSQTITRYDDLSDESGFKFQVTLRRNFDGDIIKTFKLSRAVSENIVVLDQNNRLKIYKDPISLVKDFVEVRREIISKRICVQRSDTELSITAAESKIKFIRMVLDDILVFKGKSKSDISSELSKTFDSPETIQTLMSMNFYSLTMDEIEKQEGLIGDLQKQRTYWAEATPESEYLKDLEDIH